MPNSIRSVLICSLVVLLLTQCIFMPISLVLLLVTMLLVLHFRLKQGKAISKPLIFAILIFALALIYIQYGTFLGVNAGVCILISFLFAKALETKSSRDLVVGFNFALFVNASSFLYSQSLWVTIGVFMGLVSCFIGLYRLHKVNFNNPVQPQHLGQDIKQVLSFVAYAVPFFLVLFLFFPRLPPLWHMPIPQQ